MQIELKQKDERINIIDFKGEVPSKYRSSPVPDYDREYTSHIEASRGGHSRAPSSHGRSSYKGKGHQMKSSRAAGSSEHNMVSLFL